MFYYETVCMKMKHIFNDMSFGFMKLSNKINLLIISPKMAYDLL